MAKVRRAKNVFLCVGALGTFLLAGFLFLHTSIPDYYRVSEGDSVEELLHMPLVEEKVLTADNQPASNIPRDQIKIQCSLLGVIPIKNVDVTVVAKEKVYPGGMPVGIYMKTHGVLVVGTGTVKGKDGGSYEPSSNILKSGDYIMAVNGSAVSKKEELINQVKECKGESLILQVERDNTVTELKICPVETETSEYKLGVWVRDDTQGIGTLTYMDSEGNYGALGHGISDVDTGKLMNISGGSLYHTEILSVVKGMQGSPGEMTGVIRYQNSQILGTIDTNTDRGIFGKITRRKEDFQIHESVEVAYKQDVQVGEATILTTIDGNIKEYDIYIEKVNKNTQEPNKSMVISISDQDLLGSTGGIIQGMSGSPILQNGKLVGAVTHVLVNDPTKGYGIFIENMLDAKE